MQKTSIKKVVCARCKEDITYHRLWGMWEDKIYCFECLCIVVPPLTVVSLFGTVGGEK